MSAARSRRANDKHNHLQRTPILVMGCSLLIACCIAFGGTNWTASAQPSEDQLPEQNAIVEPGYYQETIGSYEAISQSDDDFSRCSRSRSIWASKALFQHSHAGKPGIDAALNTGLIPCFLCRV